MKSKKDHTSLILWLTYIGLMIALMASLTLCSCSTTRVHPADMRYNPTVTAGGRHG